MARTIWVLSLLVLVGCKGGDRPPAPGPAVRVASVGSVIRISKGSFPADKLDLVRARLAASKDKLEPAIRGLRGCLHYWASIDPETHTIYNVSVWETLADARQMDTLEAMKALAGEFIALGVAFERPITNSQVLWDLPMPAR